MDTTKTRKQGNAVMVTIPKSFHVPAGVTLRPKLTDKGIFYEFVNDDTFFDFDENILKDLVNEGFEGESLIQQFRKRKKKIPVAIDKMISEAEVDAKPMTQKELEKEIGLFD
ncbi:MAG: toxin-antitoxin system [Limosilactobacillus sp.]|uniref:toxin-antitoxin system n=1 Tax=Limosilactobacillus sp. TaxID=2773925 RepID=UPI003F0074C7